MKKKVKKSGLILTALLIMGIIIFPMKAEASYTYKVNFILGGNGQEQSSFNTDLTDALSIIGSGVVSVSDDKNIITISNLELGDQIVFEPRAAVAIAPQLKQDDDGNDVQYSKYYVKGIRKSGSNDLAASSAITVNQDDSYVIAYGVGAAVPYIVRYIDEAGNSLLEDATFYGALDEEICVPFKYVEGYTPDANNIKSSALKENQEFVFTYKKAEAPVGGTVYENDSRTEYSTVNGDTQYRYQLIPRTVPGGVVNNREPDANQGGAAENENMDVNDDGSVTIIDEDTPLGTEDIKEIPDEPVARTTDNSATFDEYKRYAFLVSIIGAFIIILTAITAAKIVKKSDKL